MKSARVLLPFLGMLLISGCSQTVPLGNNASMTTNGDQVKITQTGSNGSTIVSTAGGQYPSEAPIPQYPGSAITVAQVVAAPTPGQPRTNIILSTKDSPQQVMAFYKTQIASKGWTSDNAVEGGGMSSLSVKTASGDLTITAMGTPEGTTVSLIGQ
jgi:hypothetical protein